MSTTMNYNLSEEELQSMVQCRVCKVMIDIQYKRDQHVVKCDNCNEATPIKDPPLGQKYIRCPCDCLLICKSTAQRISCPRPSCHKIIVLCTPATNNNQSTTEISPVPGMCRVNCGHCGEIFLFNSLVNQLARCPHCEKKSSVGREFARARSLIFLVLSVLSLVIAIALTVTTRDSATIWWIVVYSVAYLLALYFLLRSIYFMTMKSSLIISSQP